MSPTGPSLSEHLLQTLDKTERYVLMLYYGEELTPREIGLVLDLPVNRVERTLEEVRERVRSALAEQAVPAHAG
jgi:RNA polymerase sigma factor (sigma-70 family)